jgi:predicted nucleotidyltransferase
MLSFIENKKAEIHQLCEKYAVRSLFLFGSASTGKFNVESDIDILVAFQEIPLEQYSDYYFELHEALEMLLGRNVDLITERSLSNPYFIESIDETKQLLYAA